MELDIPGREVERIDRAYLFSHLDSRGGSTLVVHKNLSRALATYAASFALDDEQARFDIAEEDYVARYAIIVCDRPLARDQDDGAELLEAYRDDGGYSWGVVQARWFERSRGRWSKWEDTVFALLWEGEVPTLPASAGPPREELRVDPRDVGEDAWGLGLIWGTGTR